MLPSLPSKDNLTIYHDHQKGLMQFNYNSLPRVVRA